MSNSDQPAHQTVFGYMLEHYQPMVLPLLSITAGALGHAAGLAYLLLIGFLYPVWAAMQQQKWEEQGIVIRHAVRVRFKSEWRGIPVEDDGTVLRDVLFLQPAEMQQKFSLMAAVRLMFSTWIVMFALYQLWQGTQNRAGGILPPGSLAWWGIGLLVLAYALQRLCYHWKLLQIVRNRQWIEHEADVDGRSAIHVSAAVPGKRPRAIRPLLLTLMGESA
ncbi:hypothetical protein [Chitinilyticum piscinae]|uniref:Uncharacterized protein n=1 Tax=Chitinilyticum piscinae TaxID=2866724 RepID=A0A8J7FKM7_9NEIS|nr:hypothetical protein [Chitinilyticum piscinae]MBE9609435.1 hypothetical protein [Chitinilyticum piscinae]